MVFTYKKENGNNPCTVSVFLVHLSSVIPPRAHGLLQVVRRGGNVEVAVQVQF